MITFLISYLAAGSWFEEISIKPGLQPKIFMVCRFHVNLLYWNFRLADLLLFQVLMDNLNGIFFFLFLASI